MCRKDRPPKRHVSPRRHELRPAGVCHPLHPWNQRTHAGGDLQRAGQEVSHQHRLLSTSIIRTIRVKCVFFWDFPQEALQGATLWEEDASWRPPAGVDGPRQQQRIQRSSSPLTGRSSSSVTTSDLKDNEGHDSGTTSFRFSEDSGVIM